MRIGKKILGIIGSIMCIGIFTSCTKTEVKGIDKISISMDRGTPSWEEISIDDLSTKNSGTAKDYPTYVFIGFKANKGVLINSITYTFNNTKNLDKERLANTNFYFLNNTDSFVKEYNDITLNNKSEQQTVDLSTSPITIEINTCVDTGVYFQCVINESGEWSNISIDWREL